MAPRPSVSTTLSDAVPAAAHTTMGLLDSQQRLPSVSLRPGGLHLPHLPGVRVPHLELGPAHGLHGLHSLMVAGELHEPEATGATVPVANHGSAFDVEAGANQEGLQDLGVRGLGQAAHQQSGVQGAARLGLCCVGEEKDGLHADSGPCHRRPTHHDWHHRAHLRRGHTGLLLGPHSAAAVRESRAAAAHSCTAHAPRKHAVAAVDHAMARGPHAIAGAHHISAGVHHPVAGAHHVNAGTHHPIACAQHAITGAHHAVASHHAGHSTAGTHHAIA
mmetsp:Transcript_20031/g.44457  ORF Transcript_20031/g.44457 Transcript_20031/m.44457 type:complete len:275 (-) Transcript_20031:47-871(-)